MQFWPKIVLSLSLLFIAQASSLLAAERVALLVGCANYVADPESLSLETPLNDVDSLAAELRKPTLGFQVITVSDAKVAEFYKGLRDFKTAAVGAKVAMVYFSGHGIEQVGVNYLITVNATLETEDDLPSQTMPLSNVMKALEETGAGVKLAVLDCCRNNPFRTKSWMKTKDFVREQVLRELGQAEIPQATFVCFATGPGRKAAAVLNAKSVLSPFTDELIKEISVPGQSLRTVFENVHDRIAKATEGRQVPAVMADNALNVVFRTTVLVPATTPAVGGSSAVPSQPAMPVVPPPATPAGSSLDQGAVGKVFEVKLPGDVVMKFCYCPPGSFVMGSPKSEVGRRDDEDQVTVRISKGFWTAQTEVTQGHWKALMGSNPSNFKGDDLPVEMVSWDDAQAFITKLNQSMKLPQGWKYSLLTEAQWEYACRAGTESEFAFGNTLMGKRVNFGGNYAYGASAPGYYRNKTSPVGSYAVNAWGLHDMHGNVFEWCLDAWDGSSKLPGGTDPLGTNGSARMVRGGSWANGGQDCRSANRSSLEPGTSYIVLGFRLAVVPAER